MKLELGSVFWMNDDGGGHFYVVITPPTHSSKTRRGRSSPGIEMDYTIEVEREADGRWLAEVPELPGVLAYGATVDEAQSRAGVLALRVLAERLE